MRYPDFLKPGQTIGFVAPSFGCSIEPYRSAFDNALKVFQKKGYRTVLGPNCYEGSGIGISNTPEKCAEEFMDFYCGDQADILISCGGGELMCEILPFINFDRLRQADPKWFMGYSDNTNLGFLLATLCDTASIYGPCAPSFGMEPWHPALGDAMDVLAGNTRVHGYVMYEKESLKDEEHPLAPYNVTEPSVKKSVPGGRQQMSGRLVGGCLDILAMLCGTRYDRVKDFVRDYRRDGLIWFLEACDLTPMSYRRALWQLDQAGWFAGAKGFLIGRPMHIGEEAFGVDMYRAVLDILRKYQVPILMDLDIGHLPPQMPLINGAYADVTMVGNSITVDMKLR